MAHDLIDTHLIGLIDRIAARTAEGNRPGDCEAALRELYDLTSSKLYGVALRVVSNRDFAEDVLQDAYLNIWRIAPDYRAALSPPMAWMGVIVRSRALDFLRRRASERADAGLELNEAISETVAGDSADPMDTSQASEQAWALHECLRKLESRQREVVSLAYLRDLSHSELAEQLKLPLGTVKTWIRRGLEQLRGCMGEVRMNLTANPPLLDQLAASYALGTLRGGARRRFESMARQSATVRAAALIWQERFASMTELQLIEAPSPNVWKRIENVLSAQQQPAAAARPQEDTSMLDKLRRGLGIWRGAAFAGGLATVAVAMVGFNLSREVESQGSALAQATQQQTQLAQQNAQLAQRLEAAPQVQYVAVLADDKSAASVLVTYDPKHNSLTMKRVGGFHEAPDKSLQLWAVHSSGDVKSLGVMPEGGVVKLTAAENQVKDVGVLALSLEPKGGVPEGMPASGPILFKGQLIQAPL